MSNHVLRRQQDAVQALKPQYRATIVIGLLPSGQVQVTGQLQHKDLCEQMLNEAFTVLKQYHAKSETEEQAEEQTIIQPDRKIILAN